MAGHMVPALQPAPVAPAQFLQDRGARSYQEQDACVQHLSLGLVSIHAIIPQGLPRLAEADSQVGLIYFCFFCLRFCLHVNVFTYFLLALLMMV
jgi:hypothetical protein